MKKIILLASILSVSACSLPEQQSSVPLDMKTVQEYQQRIISGNTVDKNHPVQDEALNQSDKRKREVYYSPMPMPFIISPISYGYGYY